MGIEKMTFVDINGKLDRLDDVLLACLESGIFQPEYAAKLSEYSVGSTALMRNPYGALRVKISEMADKLRIGLRYSDPAGLGDISDRPLFAEECNEYLNNLSREYPKYFESQKRLMDEIGSYSSALDMIVHVNVNDINFDNIWNNEFLKIRFGRMPAANYQKLSAFSEKPYEVYKLDANQSSVWCLYFTADEYRDDIDKMFASLGFERLRVPDYVKGTAADAIGAIRRSLEEEKALLLENQREIQGFVEREREKFLKVYSAVEFLHAGYELRKYAVSIRDRFHLVGFVLTRDKAKFEALLSGVPDVEAAMSPASEHDRLSVPVKLRNNRFVRPFEMFVNMYGSPSYSDMDPTPFLAYTYTILFGIMFGDMGHGLCVALLGYFLWKKRDLPLGGIMTRIGMSSMFFGFCYGSVFGFENLLDPIFRAIGFAEKPIEVLHPDTTSKILIVAVALGAVSIMAAILFNMATGLRQRDFERALLSQNGLCGLVFYAAVLFGAIGVIAGFTVFTAEYVIWFILLPLLLIFFKEPIIKYMHMVNKDSMISHDTDLVKNTLLSQNDTNIPELFSSPFMTARFGRIPTDSYKKLMFYSDEPFMLYPVKTDAEYIWLIYATAIPNKAQIDAIFHDLYFERIFIPEDDLRTTEDAKAFLKKCVEAGTPPGDVPDEVKEDPAKPKTMFQKLFPDGLGNFLAVTVFEMLEVVLSFISNTMSFLRVGGFVLVHAGMMSVVFTLSGMMNSGGATVSVIIFGNIFVMCMEGLIVGIQVLRLEFYEMFSRFYGSGGDTFKPAALEAPAA